MEEWKEIKNYEGLYCISNYGRIKSLKHKNEKILVLSTNKDGYLKAKLFKNGKSKVVYAHRLVAITFLPNPNNFIIVNHKDENKQNNHINNLEWCTSKYNNNYGSRYYKNNRKLYVNEALKLLKSITNKSNKIKKVINILEKLK